MDGVVDIDGVLKPAGEAKISVFDRGFLYGDSVFEVMRTYRRRPFRERAHLERLARSCERLRIALPVAFDVIEERTARAVEAGGQSECWVRVVVTRGVGPIGLDLAAGGSPSLLVFALPLHVPPASAYQDGIAVGLVHTLRTLDGTKAAGAKTSNYLASMLALDEVKQRGCQEAVILGSRGEVVEGATSNVFAVRSGALVTPPLSAGILEGITRREVIALARARGIACVERETWPEDLVSADEVFITSTVRELLPVTSVDGKQVGDGRPGPVSLRLLQDYRERAWGAGAG